MSHGSAPGERRGGRQKGTPNKGIPRIIAKMKEDLAHTHPGDRPKAKDILQQYMLLFHGMAATYQLPPPNQQWKLDPETGQPVIDANGKPLPAKPHANHDLFFVCADRAVACAKELAKYESPQIRAHLVHVDPDVPAQAVTRIERVFVNPPKHIELDATDIMTDDSFGSRPN